MEEICVQFASSDKLEIVAAFGCPQDAKTYPNQGAVSRDDERWGEYFKSLTKEGQDFFPGPLGALGS